MHLTFLWSGMFGFEVYSAFGKALELGIISGRNLKWM